MVGLIDVVTGVEFESEFELVGSSIALFTCKFDESARPIWDLESSELTVMF